MKKLLLISILVGLLATPALASPTLANGGAALQGVLDGITVDGPSSVTAATDFISDAMDSTWELTATGSSNATMIIELASFAPENIFGVYQSGTYVQLFVGSNVAGDKVTFGLSDTFEVEINNSATGVFFTGNSFGYYLDSSFYANGGLWHSDSSLNADNQYDHMAAYQGTGDLVDLPGSPQGYWTPGEWIVAFEDLTQSASDNDYTDMVVMVESVNPIPAPGAIFLGGIGVALVGWLRRRRTL